MSTALWPERSEVDTADRAELLQHFKGVLIQSPMLRCDPSCANTALRNCRYLDARLQD